MKQEPTGHKPMHFTSIFQNSHCKLSVPVPSLFLDDMASSGASLWLGTWKRNHAPCYSDCRVQG